MGFISPFGCDASTRIETRNGTWLATGADKTIRAIGTVSLITVTPQVTRSPLGAPRGAAQGAAILRGPVQYCRHCPAILPRLRSGRPHPLARLRTQTLLRTPWRCRLSLTPGV